MNRKNINDIVRILVPVKSNVIGAPRKTVDMGDYIEIKTDRGKVDFYDEFDFTNEREALPAFFNKHDIVLQHSNFIARLNNARVWGSNGAVIGEGDYFIKDVSREFNKGLNIAHSVYYTIKQVKSKFLKGNIAVIGTAGANVYYHWMLDILPRLALISTMIPLDSVDYFITEFAQLPFQKETVDKAGIPLHKIMASNDNWNFHIKAEILFVPSLAGPLDQPDIFQVDFLRTLYKDCISTQPAFRKIYISRKKTGRRQIVNEDELITCLSKHNFEIIYCEEMKVAEQVTLFSEANLIICSHGSALTNLVFCKPGTRVLDIFNTSHINSCFWLISRIVSLDYHYMAGLSKSIDGNPKNDNTILDIIEFKKMLEKIGLPC